MLPSKAFYRQLTYITRMCLLFGVTYLSHQIYGTRNNHSSKGKYYTAGKPCCRVPSAEKRVKCIPRHLKENWRRWRIVSPQCSVGFEYKCGRCGQIKELCCGCIVHGNPIGRDVKIQMANTTRAHLNVSSDTVYDISAETILFCGFAFSPASPTRNW
jgi:hypothetical protein